MAVNTVLEGAGLTKEQCKPKWVASTVADDPVNQRRSAGGVAIQQIAVRPAHDWMPAGSTHTHPPPITGFTMGRMARGDLTTQAPDGNAALWDFAVFQCIHSWPSSHARLGTRGFHPSHSFIMSLVEEP